MVTQYSTYAAGGAADNHAHAVGLFFLRRPRYLSLFGPITFVVLGFILLLCAGIRVRAEGSQWSAGLVVLGGLAALSLVLSATLFRRVRSQLDSNEASGLGLVVDSMAIRLGRFRLTLGCHRCDLAEGSIITRVHVIDGDECVLQESDGGTVVLRVLDDPLEGAREDGLPKLNIRMASAVSTSGVTYDLSRAAQRRGQRITVCGGRAHALTGNLETDLCPVLGAIREGLVPAWVRFGLLLTPLSSFSKRSMQGPSLVHIFGFIKSTFIIMPFLVSVGQSESEEAAAHWFDQIEDRTFVDEGTSGLLHELAETHNWRVAVVSEGNQAMFELGSDSAD